MQLDELRKFIKETILLEAAQTIASAASAGVGLFQQPFELMSGSDATSHILYDTVQMIEQLTSVRKLSKKIFLGVIEIKENHGHGQCNGAVEVMAVAAEKGYGPLLYDIAMAEHGILMPDREQLSAHAAKVWAYYKERDDVISTPFHDINDASNAPDSDACCLVYDPQNPNYKDDSRNMSYEANFLISTTQISKNHSQALNKVVDHFAKQGLRVQIENIEKMLGKRAREYFVEVYQKKVLGK